MSLRVPPAIAPISVFVGSVLPLFTSIVAVTPAVAVSGIINGDGVDVGDQWTLPGDDGAPGDGGSPGGGSWLGPYRPQIPWELAHAYCVALIVPPSWCASLEPTDSTPDQPAVPDLNFSDVSHVAPESPRLTTQPSGWSVVGVETNLIAHIQTHIVTTRVRGLPVEVRFTPVRYDWAFGDGNSATTSVPGAEWSQLGVSEFARTPTSHRFMLAQDVVPHVDVTYAIDYRWPEHTWRDIEGSLMRGADATVVFVQNAGTVLVTGPCSARDARVGCR